MFIRQMYITVSSVVQQTDRKTDIFLTSATSAKSDRQIIDTPDGVCTRGSRHTHTHTHRHTLSLSHTHNARTHTIDTLLESTVPDRAAAAGRRSVSKELYESKLKNKLLGMKPLYSGGYITWKIAW